MAQYQAKYTIQMGENGPRRPADEDEDRGIDAHVREYYPKCDGSMISDEGDQTLWAKPYLRCKGPGCGNARVYPEKAHKPLL